MATTKSEMPPLHAADALAQSTGGAGIGGGGGTNGGGVGSVSSTAATSSTNTNSSTTTTAINNTISAAADSSDNQPATPQPQIIVSSNEQQQQAASASHHPYATHHMYAATGSSNVAHHMYVGAAGMYNANDMQQQQHQQQQSYASYMNSYEQFYQQQQAAAGTGQNFDNASNSLMYGSTASADYKQQTGVRYHPYLQHPTSVVSSAAQQPNDATENAVNANLGSNSNNGGVSTTTNALSPRVVSSSSPTSTSNNTLPLGSSAGNGNPSSPGCKLQCKKCGILCTNEKELREHITSVHAASPYGSSGYSSSPYIKEELSANTQTASTQQHGSGGNPGEILDLDSQKMVYPPLPQSMLPHQSMHETLALSDPLHSMHSMQQRAMPNWEQSAVENLPAYMQQQQQQQTADMLLGKPPPPPVPTAPNQSPYYSPKQSPYHSSVAIKQEFPIIKSEYADSQNYVDKSFDPTAAGAAAATDMCHVAQQQQQNTQMLPVSSSPAEFPSTTTGPQEQQNAQQYRSFEPPSSSSVLPATGVTSKAATWKSNEARRPKTYNCTACNKWFTSSGHLKRHYNTTLHKNAVKSSGKPDPATLPISAHHHPARDPNVKHSRRSNAAAAAAAAAAQQQQQPPAPVQPPEPPRNSPDFVGAQHFASSPSPTQQLAGNGMAYSAAQQNGYVQQQYMQQQQVQSTTASASPQHASNQHTVHNGHPNGLAGPSAPITTTPMPSSHTRGLLNTTTTTRILAKIEATQEDNNNSKLVVLERAATAAARSPMDIADTTMVKIEPMEQSLAQQRQQQQQLDYYHQLEYQQQRHYHNSNINSSSNNNSSSSSSNMPRHTQVPSPLIISHPAYQVQRAPQLPAITDSIFSHTQQQQLQQQALIPDIMDQQYSITPSAINTQPQHSNSMHYTINTATTSMDSMQQQQQHTMLHNHHQQQQQPQLSMLQHSNISNITHTMPCYQQLQPASGSALQPPEHTMNYHTIIGNGGSLNTDGELLQLTTMDTYGNFLSSLDGQLLQFLPSGQPYFTLPSRAAVAESYAPLSPYTAQRSPQEADLPPMHSNLQESQQSQTVLSALPYSPTISSSTTLINCEEKPLEAKQTTTAAAGTAIVADASNSNKCNKRKRNASKKTCSTTVAVDNGSGISCLLCNKEFTKICYLTQHNKSFHSGEYPFRCQSCGKRFQAEDIYKIHLTRHKAVDKPHKCELCPKQFHHKTDLRRHVEAIHTGIKQHSCEICEKRFCRKDHLRKHLETHNRVRVVAKPSSVKRTAKTAIAKQQKKELTANTRLELEISDVRSIARIKSELNDTPSLLLLQTSSVDEDMTADESLSNHSDFDNEIRLQQEQQQQDQHRQLLMFREEQQQQLMASVGMSLLRHTNNRSEDVYREQ